MTAKCRYKYESVADALCEDIRLGRYPTGRLPEEKELCARFKVGKITVYNALKRLVEEGVLKRVQGKGTFVNGVYGKTLTISGQVPVVMPHVGHYYSNLASNIRRFLYERGLFSIPMDYQQHSKGIANSLAVEQMSLLLNSNIHGVIYDGGGYYEYPFLKDYPHLRSVAVDCFDAPGEIPGAAVLIDYKSGVRKAVEHLAGKGCERIIFIAHEPGNFPIEDRVHAARHPLVQMRTGYHDAMRDLGFAELAETVKLSRDHIDDQLRGVLVRKNKPDAVICYSDNYALKVILATYDLGISVPDDLLVVGAYNTPWAEECPVPITSISYREDVIAEKAVELLTADVFKREIVESEPELVVRESA